MLSRRLRRSILRVTPAGGWEERRIVRDLILMREFDGEHQVSRVCAHRTPLIIRLPHVLVAPISAAAAPAFVYRRHHT